MFHKVISYIVRKFKKIFLRNFSYEVWNVGIIKANPGFLLQSPDLAKLQITWLPTHKRFSYYADPFPYLYKENFYLFVEDFNYYNKRGAICCLQVDASSGNIVKKREIFKNDTHYSYPLILSENNNFYIIPETSSLKELSLYKAVDFPEIWEKEKILLRNKDVIDATLFYYENYYWIFYTTRSKIHPQDSELHIAFSSNLQSSFKEHPANPVKVDSSSSRPAGNIFIHKNKLYRPAQDCSRNYGENIVVNEIITLNKTEYIEKQVSKVSMKNHPYYKDGIHTVNFAGEYMVFDAKKRIYSPLRIFINIYRKFRRIFRAFVARLPIP